VRAIKAVAWDVDGTLVDSEPLHHRALIAASADWGVDLSDLPPEHFRGAHMRAVWAILRPRMPPQLSEAAWQAAIVEHYVQRRAELKPLPGAVETVATLAARGIPQACVSNSTRRIVESNLDALRIRPHIAFSVALDDVRNGKPDPEPYRTAAERLGVAPDEVLAVEDSEAGAISALAAGLSVALCAPIALRAERVWRVSDLTAILDWPGLDGRSGAAAKGSARP
jgi:HAD superfamily hydrolase (TIGR01509 family)